jgi:hypothetical protein
MIFRHAALANRRIPVYCRHCHVSAPEDHISRMQNMLQVLKIAIFSFVIVALAVISETASARGGLYPVTRCGPDLAYLCPIRGYFDQPPFHYNLAIYPGCIKELPVRTSYGIERRRVLVCG